MAGFDWPTLLAAGVRDLRLKPAEFWALTPGEFALMLGPGAGQATMNRAGFERLMAAYPDQKKGADHG